MYLARPSLLEDKSVPEGVRRYFSDYAREESFLDEKILILRTKLSFKYDDYPKKNRSGIGPGHSADLREYEKWMPKREDRREGVKPGTMWPVSVLTWIEENRNKVAILYDPTEYNDCGACGDD